MGGSGWDGADRDGMARIGMGFGGVCYGRQGRGLDRMMRDADRVGSGESEGWCGVGWMDGGCCRAGRHGDERGRRDGSLLLRSLLCSCSFCWVGEGSKWLHVACAWDLAFMGVGGHLVHFLWSLSRQLMIWIGASCIVESCSESRLLSPSGGSSGISIEELAPSKRKGLQSFAALPVADDSACPGAKTQQNSETDPSVKGKDEPQMGPARVRLATAILSEWGKNEPKVEISRPWGAGVKLIIGISTSTSNLHLTRISMS